VRLADYINGPTHQSVRERSEFSCDLRWWYPRMLRSACVYLPIRCVDSHVLMLQRSHHDEHKLEIVEQPQLLCVVPTLRAHNRVAGEAKCWEEQVPKPP
jgi:hypothetical protein